MWICINKSSYFTDLFWRLENLDTWLADNILAHISGKNFFPNMWFTQEHKK